MAKAKTWCTVHYITQDFIAIPEIDQLKKGLGSKRCHFGLFFIFTFAWARVYIECDVGSADKCSLFNAYFSVCFEFRRIGSYSILNLIHIICFKSSHCSEVGSQKDRACKSDFERDSGQINMQQYCFFLLSS